MSIKKLYIHLKCSTCKKALDFLNGRGIAFDPIDIQKTPPSVEELRQMSQFYEDKRGKLLNTSGQLYRALGLKEKLGDMNDEELFLLLSKEGMLVRRPFILTETGGTVGFREEEWEQLFQAAV